MVRKIEVTVPNHWAQQIQSVLKSHRSVHHLVIIPCRDNVLFQFKVVNKKADELIEKLTMYGVATKYGGTLDVIALRSSKPRVTTYRDSGKRKKAYSYHDRLPFDEIEESIDGQLHLTFDYLALIVVGAMIAGVGLLTDSSVSVVASMLVSPLMGPILGMTFGHVIKKQDMFRKALRNEIVGVLVCFFTGGVLGFVASPFLDPASDENLANGNNTQMSSRGDPGQLIWGALIACPSGMGVALGVASDQVSALIGVAISAALLPPITNSGLALAMGLVMYLQGIYSEKEIYVYVSTGAISMVLFLMNWVLIFVFGIITFHLKRVDVSYKRLQDLNKFVDLEQQHGTDANSTNSNLAKPLLTSEYGSVSGQGLNSTIGMTSSDRSAAFSTPQSNNSNKQKSNFNITTTPTQQVLKKGGHKKSMTMTDNQDMQGDSIFDLQENKRKKSTLTHQSLAHHDVNAMFESQGNLDRRVSDGAVIKVPSDWNEAIQGINNKNNTNANLSDKRMRHGSVDRHAATKNSMGQ